MADTVIKLSADDARNLAIGKALSLIAGVVGVVGGLYTLSTNPVAKDRMKAVWGKLPVPIQENKVFTFTLAGFAVAAILGKLVVNSQKKPSLS